MSDYGFIRVAAAAPKLAVANTAYNINEITECIKAADKQGCALVLFPELCITGATCGDLFFQDFLYQKSMEGLEKIIEFSKGVSVAAILGFYLETGGTRVNCAAFIQDGQIRGVVPKVFIPPSQAKWFSPGSQLAGSVRSVRVLGKEVPFGHLLFEDSVSRITFGIEIGEDMEKPISPGALLALAGANILFTPAAARDFAGNADFRRELVLTGSAKGKYGAIFSSAGVHESTTDFVYGGQNMIVENGVVIAEGIRFSRDNTILYGDLDTEMLRSERMKAREYGDASAFYTDCNAFTTVPIAPLCPLDEKKELLRTYAKNPFLPEREDLAAARCAEIFQIQCAGLAKRLTHIKSEKTVLGVSGGLDSTLALLVCAQTHQLLGKSAKDILTLTMPGFGTTDRTHGNAQSLMGLLETEMREIPIRDSVLQHFKDIGHDPEVHDVTYENAQARERTQVLMDIANKEKGLLVGTGDLSESALGWCTYNGDHMSMYNVNAGVPKTMIQHILRWFIREKLPVCDGFCLDRQKLGQTLQSILDTPISPELLPPDKSGKIAQKTEDSVGPYPLNDFFIYYTLRYGMGPKKLLRIAKNAFSGEYSEEVIKKWMAVFYRRFFSQQFKRTCSVDGPKVCAVGLSPRGGLSMPSDADCAMWLAEMERL